MTQIVNREEAGAGSLTKATYPLVNLLRWIVGALRAPRPSGVPLAPAWRRHGAPLAVAAVLIGASMLWLDAPVAEAMRHVSPTVKAVFSRITEFGRSGWILYPLGILLVAVALADRPALARWPHLALSALVARLGFLFVAIALPGLVVSILKGIIGRARPPVLDPFAYQPLTWTWTYGSLPSGHACTAFGALVAFGALFPKMRPLLWTFALLIAASRMIVGSHYPSDVLAGAAFGAFGAIVVRDWFARRRLGFFVAPDGRVRAGSWPGFARLKGVARRLFAP
jgi:undecaprenyl-diphosphatase